MDSISFRYGFCLLICYSSISIASANGRIRKGPEPLRGGEHGVGSLIPAASFEDLSGQSHQLDNLAKSHRAVVLAMTSTSCPLSLKYLPTLVDLSKKYAAKDIHFVAVNSVATDKTTEMQEAQARLGDRVTYVFDKSGAFAKQVGAQTTTDVIVFDSNRTVIYHGAIDDQYGFGYAREQPRNEYLVDALEALLADQNPPVEATAAPGCRLSIKKSKPTVNTVTYHGRVSRLMNRHCVKCHRDGGVGPFPLDSYDNVVSHAPMVREVITRGVMPPWFAATDDHAVISPWSNDASMTPSEKSDLLAWIEGSQAEGDAADAPQPLSFHGRWQIGTPDAIYEFPRAIPIKATGVMPYKHVTVEIDLDEDKWVQEVEILPSNLSVVHHVLVYAIPPGESIENPIDYWAVYVPGNGAHTYPDGYARRLRKGSKLHFQMHYTPNGTATEDKTQIGFRFADQPPRYEVQTASVVNGRFRIPPGAKRHKVEAKLRIPIDAEILGFLPHHHLRGVAARYELVSKQGDTELLLDVPDYDFNWQLFYQYADPPVFEKGSTIRYSGWYDNSADNPANPNPNVTVRWGPQTEDEMHVGYVEYAEPLNADWKGKHAGLRGKLLKDFADLDLDDDGELSPDEVVKLIPDWAPIQFDVQQVKRFFLVLDTDKSGGLNEKEFQRIRRQFDRRRPGIR